MSTDFSWLPSFHYFRFCLTLPIFHHQQWFIVVIKVLNYKTNNIRFVINERHTILHYDCFEFKNLWKTFSTLNGCRKYFDILKENNNNSIAGRSERVTSCERAGLSAQNSSALDRFSWKYLFLGNVSCTEKLD